MEHEDPMTWPGAPMPEPLTQKVPFLPGHTPEVANPSWRTAKAQAAIALKVPMSDIPELDAMIRESRRLDMATAALQGFLVNSRFTDFSFEGEIESAFKCADTLLAESEKEKP